MRLTHTLTRPAHHSNPTHHHRRTMQHESKDQILSAAIEQIRRDLENGEVEALTVLLATIRPEWLESYLPEDAWPRPTACAVAPLFLENDR